MSFRYLDMEHYERIEHFRYFLSMPYPYAGVTVDIDVTDIVSFCKARGYSFYLTFLHAAAKAADRVPELRRRLLDGQVVEFDRCCPSYTAMKDSGVYVYCLVDSGLLPYEDFLADGKRRQAEALKGEGLAESGDPLSNFFVSCVPWLAYTQLKHPVTGPEDTNPRFSWGKFTEMNGRVTMPVTVFVNHALADGLHIARFYENLDQELAEIVKQIKNS